MTNFEPLREKIDRTASGKRIPLIGVGSLKSLFHPNGVAAGITLTDVLLVTNATAKLFSSWPWKYSLIILAQMGIFDIVGDGALVLPFKVDYIGGKQLTA